MSSTNLQHSSQGNSNKGVRAGLSYILVASKETDSQNKPDGTRTHCVDPKPPRPEQVCVVSFLLLTILTLCIFTSYAFGNIYHIF